MTVLRLSSCAAAATTAAMVLAGWVLGAESITSVDPSWPSSKIISACATLASAAMVAMMCHRGHAGQLIRPFAVSMLAQGVLFTSAASFIAHVSVNVLELGHWAISETASRANPFPGMPSIPSLVCLAATGVAGIVYVFNTPRRLWRIHWCAMAVGGISTASLLGYSFGFPRLFLSQYSSGMGLFESLGLFFLAVGLHETARK